MMNQLFKHCIAAITLVCLTHCSEMTDYIFEEEDIFFIDELILSASPTMNKGMPLRVDFVIVKDPIIAEHVAKLSARQFMKQRKQLKLDHPENIKIKSFEMIPNQSIVTPLKYLRNQVAAAFLFADYNNQHKNRWKIYTSDVVTVKLLDKTLAISSHKWNEKEKSVHSRENDGIVVLN